MRELRRPNRRVIKHRAHIGNSQSITLFPAARCRLSFCTNLLRRRRDRAYFLVWARRWCDSVHFWVCDIWLIYRHCPPSWVSFASILICRWIRCHRWTTPRLRLPPLRCTTHQTIWTASFSFDLCQWGPDICRMHLCSYPTIKCTFYRNACTPPAVHLRKAGEEEDRESISAKMTNQRESRRNANDLQGEAIEV